LMARVFGLVQSNARFTNVQESTFGRQRRPQGEGHGWPESNPAYSVVGF